jgi:hypothetical protein
MPGRQNGVAPGLGAPSELNRDRPSRITRNCGDSWSSMFLRRDNNKDDEGSLFQCLLAMAAVATAARYVSPLLEIDEQFGFMLMGAAAGLAGVALFTLIETLSHDRLARIETIRWPFRIYRDLAGRCQGRVTVGTIPIRSPLPYIARHIEQTISVGWERAYRSGWARKRVPTEAEFEFASRGGLDRKRYDWGDEFMPADKHMANTFQGSRQGRPHRRRGQPDGSSGS